MALLAWVMSENRRKIPWRIVFSGLGLQFALALLLLKTPLRAGVFAGMQKVVDVLTAATNEGSSFVFGALTKGFTLKQDAVVGANSDLMVFPAVAFQVLPVIILVSAIAGVLYHLRVIQAVVRGVAWTMRYTLKTSGAETFGAALLIFTGIESMTAIRAYLKGMTRSELCTVMTTFMATIAGSVMVVYASFGAAPGHLLAASLMSAPAAILVSKLMVPETGEPETRGGARIEIPIESHNVLDAAARGTSEGLYLALNVGAMLIAFIGIVYLLDLFLTALTGLSFAGLMSYVFRPFAVVMGVPLQDVSRVSELLGTKTVLNEFLAYASLGDMMRNGALSPRSVTIATYALCGFANPGSMGILIAGLTGIVPERRKDIVQLGLRAFVGGTLACFMTACVAGILIYD